MFKEVFIRDFSTLGESVRKAISGLSGNTLLNSVFEVSLQDNPLFTHSMQIEALMAICNKFLNTDSLNRWLSRYNDTLFERNKTIGIVMAGNLPLVGFHDFLVVMASGCIAKIKLSGKDKVLLPIIFKMLCEINPIWKDKVFFIEQLPENIDLLLATGGEQAAALFNKKYSNIPKIVRSSKFSIAVLSGGESFEELTQLSNDVFLYYGLGCRSVSTLIVPEGYDFERLIQAFAKKKLVITSEDYLSAYRYQKAVAEMKKEWHIDGGFYLLKEFQQSPPPIGVINILFYSTVDQIYAFVESNKNMLQCVVAKNQEEPNIKFGETQYPSITDYADGINSLEFILNNI